MCSFAEQAYVSCVPGERTFVNSVGCQEQILMGAGKTLAQCCMNKQVAAICNTLCYPAAYCMKSD
jgi:hypothetical protein